MRILLLVVLLTACATPAAAETVRTFSREFEAAELRSLRLSVPVGAVEIRAGSSEQVVVDVRLRCDRGDDRCAEYAEKIELDHRERSHELRLEFDGPRHWDDDNDLSIEVQLEVPASLELELDLGVGDVQVFDVENHVAVDVGVGQVEVRMREELVRSVDLEVGIGDATMSPRSSRSRSRSFLGEDIRWRDGEGHARIAVDVGVGEVDVRLR
ncbi:MAG: hypothetical protein JSW67_08070 [Candidatus Latescibacterota bacterium]|nr:MAG: hypothetical protein JSW67_08070 [Candidatus Latescibacterota bacterium]